MADLRRDLRILRKPSNIRRAELASSPYVLRKILAADPTIRRLIRAGEEVVPLILEETRRAERLSEITLAAFAFIVERVSPEAAPEVLRVQFRRAVKKPGPYFVHFAAHAIRSGLQMRLKPLEMVYSHAELIETQDALR